ncbi:hypothetical protein [Nocardia niwae]|uniref:hypothetical protein n=1 Tax=Nocardia niwae TaxID=626084 RepID=UPI0033E4DE25
MRGIDLDLLVRAGCTADSGEPTVLSRSRTMRGRAAVDPRWLVLCVDLPDAFERHRYALDGKVGRRSVNAETSLPFSLGFCFGRGEKDEADVR